MEVKVVKFCDKFEYFSGLFPGDVSSFPLTIKRGIPVEMPQHDNTATKGNKW